jgi:hypothetical protein
MAGSGHAQTGHQTACTNGVAHLLVEFSARPPCFSIREDKGDFELRPSRSPAVTPTLVDHAVPNFPPRLESGTPFYAKTGPLR